MIRKLCFSLQAYIRVFSTSGHCRYTLLWVLDELPVLPLSWEFGSTWSAVSAVWISAVVKALDAASTLSFYTHLARSSISIGCRILATCLHWCGMQYNLLGSILHTFPLGISGSEPAASAVLLQSLYGMSVCGSAERHDTGDSFLVWTFFCADLWGFFFLLLLKWPWQLPWMSW